jgi:hypothetical protein
VCCPVWLDFGWAVADPLFGRAYRLSVGDVEISNLESESLRITFEIERTKKSLGNPNRADVAVYGFSRETRDRLAAMAAGGWVNLIPTIAEKRAAKKTLPPGITIKLEAGWDGTVEQIFLGALREVHSEFVGTDRITTFGAADSERELKLAKVRLSLKKGTPVTEVVRQLASALGVKEGNASSVVPRLGAAELIALQQPLHLIGCAGEELDWFVRSCGYEWSIQDGALQIVQTGKAVDVPGRSSPVFTPDTGLIGEAKVDSSGIVSGVALLSANLVPGRAFRIESKAVTGNFRAIKTVHRGDSHAAGQSWVTEFEGDAL